MIRPAVQIDHNSSPPSRQLPRPRRQRHARAKAHNAPSSTPSRSFRPRHAFLLLIVLIAQAVFFSSTIFQVQRIRVAGTETVSNKQILTRAALKSGTYMWKTSPATVAARVAQVQNLETIRVNFSLPGEVNIVVKERQPAYQVASNSLNPTWYAVDKHGLVLRPLKGTDNHLPRLKLEEQLQVGRRLHPALLATCSQACTRIEQEFPGSVWYYTLDQRGNLSFRTFSRQYPVDVQLGTLDNLEHKLTILRALQQDVLKKQRICLIDLRFPTPVVRLLNPPKAPPKVAETQTS